MSYLEIVFGAAIALVSSVVTLEVQRRIAKKEQLEEIERKRVSLVSALLIEIEKGMARANGLADKREKGQISFSRIHTPYWFAAVREVIHLIDDAGIVRAIGMIYYRFDLINFNMEQGDPTHIGAGHAFAHEYIVEMDANFAMVKNWAHERFGIKIDTDRVTDQQVGETEAV